jgi:hypothetical protein
MSKTMLSSAEFFRECVSFLRGERSAHRAWESLITAAEEGSLEAFGLTVSLIGASDNCRELGALAGGPLYEFADSTDADVHVRLSVAAERDVRLGRCLVAVDRYTRAVAGLQIALSRATSCESSSNSARPLGAHEVIRKVVERCGDDGCVAVENPYAAYDAVNYGEEWPLLLADIRAASDRSLLMDLATRLDSLLLHAEHRLVTDVVAQVVASPAFRCCLSYATLWGLSERTVATLRVVTDAIERTSQR